ncbi:MAG: hypothetical protein P1U74_05595 [Legionellaceae bacterium]|nr:hypothetical protein [Legionellaceae bacterium]
MYRCEDFEDVYILEKKDLDDAFDILTNIFVEDKYFQRVLEYSEDKKASLKYILNFFLEYAIEFKTCFATADLSAISISLPPGHIRIPFF